MKNIKNYGLHMLIFALLTLAVAFFFTSMEMKEVASMGTYVGMAGVVLTGWRLSSGNNAALQDIAMEQRAADFFGGENQIPEEKRLTLNLPVGTLLLSSLSWVVLMQVAYHLLK